MASELSRLGERIITVINQFRLYDRDDAMILALFGVFGKDLAINSDGRVGRSRKLGSISEVVVMVRVVGQEGEASFRGTNVKSGAPFSKTQT